MTDPRVAEIAERHAQYTWQDSAEMGEAITDLLASLQVAQAEVERLRSELQEVDVLLEEYGIDTVGTGSSPGLKEEKRVLDILEKVTARLAAAGEREA